jgi:antitoxin CptB
MKLFAFPGRGAARSGALQTADIVCIALYITHARLVRAFGVGAHRPGKATRREWNTMTERSSEGLDVRRRKLLFRAWRRGVREMDLIVGRFADVHIDKFDERGLDDFEHLIEAGNVELYAWVTGTASAPSEYDTAVLAQLKAFHDRTGKESVGEGR